MFRYDFTIRDSDILAVEFNGEVCLRYILISTVEAFQIVYVADTASSIASLSLNFGEIVPPC